MNRIFATLILGVCLLELSNGYCCFRDPLMQTSKCVCPDSYTSCGIVKCQKTCANSGSKPCGCSQPVCSNIASNKCDCGQPIYLIGSNKCDCGQATYMIGSNKCDCGQATYMIGSNKCDCGQPTYLDPSICDCGLPACSCYRDTSNVCYVCEEPSPMCSCLKATNSDCGCKCENMKSFIYFPEVEYPLVATDTKPYFYGGCYTY